MQKFEPGASVKIMAVLIIVTIIIIMIITTATID